MDATSDTLLSEWGVLTALYERGRRGQATFQYEDDSELIARILDCAKKIISHPTRPTHPSVTALLDLPQAELALDESVEENPFLTDVASLRVETVRERPLQCVAMLDMSTSMAGEKHLLASIAVAVLLLELHSDESSLVSFSSNAKCMKAFGPLRSMNQVLRDFLRLQPSGFTNIAAALETGLEQLSRSGRKRRRVGLLATDGRSTDGADPIPLARRYDSLVVLHLHGPGSTLEGSKDLAAAGHGICLEVKTGEELPRKLYEALRRISRM